VTSWTTSLIISTSGYEGLSKSSARLWLIY
jgi:hypothetical protein